ncbi:MAG: hypothetical protein EBX81_02695 [bacterium]|nr:hypothetical protein [Candidatus Aquidulcis sp.]
MTLRRAIALAGAAVLCFSGVVGMAAANPTPADAATFVLKPCTDWKSQISPPDTIRVLRTNSGVVEVIPFKLYVYRTHVAEFYTEYKSSPYSDALLGVGAMRRLAWRRRHSHQTERLDVDNEGSRLVLCVHLEECDIRTMASR